VPWYDFSLLALESRKRKAIRIDAAVIEDQCWRQALAALGAIYARLRETGRLCVSIPKRRYDGDRNSS